MVVGSSGEDIMDQEVAGNDMLGHHSLQPRAGVPDPSVVAGDFDQVVVTLMVMTRLLRFAL